MVIFGVIVKNVWLSLLREILGNMSKSVQKCSKCTNMHKSHSDQNETLLVVEYLIEIRQYLKDIINGLK